MVFDEDRIMGGEYGLLINFLESDGGRYCNWFVCCEYLCIWPKSHLRVDLHMFASELCF